MVNNKPDGTAVKIDKASFHFKKLKAVDELSLDVPSGISFGLLGPNGAGKTTLIRLLAGLLKPKSGSIEVLGQQPSRKTAYLIGYMPQLHSLYSELSVIQNINFFAKIYGLKNKKEIWRMDSLLGRMKQQAKNLIARDDSQSKKEEKQLVDRLVRLNLVAENAKMDDILGLDIRNIMDRRLQTQVFSKGLARSVKQARQFIIHGHIFVKDKNR